LIFAGISGQKVAHFFRKKVWSNAWLKPTRYPLRDSDSLKVFPVIAFAQTEMVRFANATSNSG